MSEEVVEQITRDPIKEEQKTSINVSKKKDPKKVAAGKKLAEYNKKAKEALAREMKREEKIKREEQNENTESEYNQEKPNNEAKAWLPELSFTTVLSIVGIGFTAFDMFMRYRQISKEDNKNRMPACPTASQVSKIPQPLTPQPLDRPKIGMM